MRRDFPQQEWGIVSLKDGTQVAGYVHVERLACGPTIEIDVPALPETVANVAIYPRSAVREAHACSLEDVLQFIRRHPWPKQDRPDADRLPPVDPTCWRQPAP